MKCPFLRLLLLVPLWGCADPSEPLVCDPSRHGEIFFGYQTIWPESGHDRHVQVENGSVFLFIDHACRFWVFEREDPPTFLWSSAREGTLSTDQLRRLNEDIFTRSWGSVAGERSVTPGVSDASITSVWREAEVASCSGVCGSASAELSGIVAASRSAISRLADEGTEMEGPMRVAAREGDWLAPITFSDWVGTSEIQSWYPAEERYGGHVLVSDGDAEILRDLRRRYRSGELSGIGDGYLPLTQSGLYHAVFARDSLPIEDGQGLVRPPDLPAR